MKTRTAAFAWIALAVVLVYLLGPIFWKVSRLKREEGNLKEEVRLLEAKNQVLENRLRLIENDPVYVEYIARKKFRKAKEGEVIYRLVAPEEEQEGAQSTR